MVLLVAGGILLSPAGVGTARADEMDVKEDLTVEGTGGTLRNPNVDVKGNAAVVGDLYIHQGSVVSPYGGVGRYHLVVQMKKLHEGSGKNVIMSAFALHHDVKQVILVDEDIDIYDSNEVQWAVATRFQADQDLVLVSNCRASRLDPTSRNGIGAKLGLDATKPLAAEPSTFTRIRIPGKDELDLAAVLESRSPTEWRDSVSSAL